MSCSAVTLSLATLSGVAAVTLIAIAFGTDNWTEIRVDRAAIRKQLDQTLDVKVREDFSKSKNYFSRDLGLFRECFYNERPVNVKTYLSPTETHCININYYIPEGEDTSTFEEDQTAWLHLARASVALIICSFIWIGVTFLTGVAGCWCRSSSKIIATGVFMLIAGLFAAGGIGCWHGKEYYERFKINKEPYYLTWDKNLKDHTRFIFGWSYIVCWIGVGWCLISFILLFCAAKCLRDEKQREEIKHMQYLMPVYPGKQPYGYGYAAYPGPYYPHHGSQYGPYSY